MPPAHAESLAGRVAVVTGGGGGIGSAAAAELARRGATVVVADPGVGVQGGPPAEPTAQQTTDKITAAGGRARASTVSVTDAAAVRSLFDEVAAEFGSLDVVLNPAGIIRYPSADRSAEEDWTAVVDVHLNGYLNVLAAALPIMARAGYGRVAGFTSGAGLARAAGGNAAYGCAKRAVAALTWQLGRVAPPGVTVNALSPIAATRMVRPAPPATAPGVGGLDLSSLPPAEAMAPAAAYMAGEHFGWCSGQVIFSAGTELSVIGAPRMLEAIRIDGTPDLAAVLDAAVPAVLGPAEAEQRSTGGSNPRTGLVVDAESGSAPAKPVHQRAPGGAPSRRERLTCVLVSDDEPISHALREVLGAAGVDLAETGGPRGGASTVASGPTGFAAAGQALRRAAAEHGPVDAIVVALSGRACAPGSGSPWQQLLDSHAGTAQLILTHAAWNLAAGEHAAAAAHPLRIVHMTRASSPGATTAAHAAAQMARYTNAAADRSQPGHVAAFSVSLETSQPADDRPFAQIVSHLIRAEGALVLAGAELVTGSGWMGLRSHPGPVASASCWGTEIPPWMDGFLKEAIGWGP
jgi:NAD(P)-dependent dehydrogenase (short-subunit alcohol dehydrogenase family)